MKVEGKAPFYLSLRMNKMVFENGCEIILIISQNKYSKIREII